MLKSLFISINKLYNSLFICINSYNIAIYMSYIVIIWYKSLSNSYYIAIILSYTMILYISHWLIAIIAINIPIPTFQWVLTIASIVLPDTVCMKQSVGND